MIADDDEKARAIRKQQERSNKRLSRHSGDGGDISVDGVLDEDGSKKMKLGHSVDSGIFDRMQQQQQLQQQHVLAGAGLLGGQLQGASFVYPQQVQHQQQQQQQLNVHQQQQQQQQQQLDAIQSLERFYLEREKLYAEAELEKEKSRQQHDLLADLDRRNFIDERLKELKAKVDSQAQMLNAALSLLEKIALKFDNK